MSGGAAHAGPSDATTPRGRAQAVMRWGRILAPYPSSVSSHRRPARPRCRSSPGAASSVSGPRIPSGSGGGEGQRMTLRAHVRRPPGPAHGRRGRVTRRLLCGWLKGPRAYAAPGGAARASRRPAGEPRRAAAGRTPEKGDSPAYRGGRAPSGILMTPRCSPGRGGRPRLGRPWPFPPHSGELWVSRRCH